MCLPDGSETCRHDRDTSPINDHQRDLDTHDELYTLHEYHMIVWTINVVFHSLCHAILHLFEIRSSVSPYLVRSRYRQVIFTRFTIWHPMWPSHMLASFEDVISSSGPRGITPSLGWTNPTLDPYASTDTFGMPESHLYNNPVTVWRLMSTKHPSGIGD